MVGFVGSVFGRGRVGHAVGRTGSTCSNGVKMVVFTERTSTASSSPFAVPSSSPMEVSVVREKEAEGREEENGWCFGEQSVRLAIEAIGRGEMVLVTDNADRENEGDLIMAADKISAADVAFMVRHTSGVICVSIPPETADRLKLGPMVPNNSDPKKTAFTVSCDYKYGISTGISAQDRAITLRALADPDSKAEDFYRPGHIFPLKYHEDGVMKRGGHTEAALDLCLLANMAPAGVLCEIVDHTDGSMARRPALETFAREHGLVMTSVADLIQYRKRNETHVAMVGSKPARLPTKFGIFEAYAFQSRIDGAEHLAIVKGNFLEDKRDVLVRVEIENVTGHVFGSPSSNSSHTLEESLRIINEEGSGCLIYIRSSQEHSPKLSEELFAPEQPVKREVYQTAAQILSSLEISSIRLLANDQSTANALSGFGFDIKEQIPFTS